MAWLGKVTLGNLSDFAGAVTKLSESVKNIEKNFDSALGFDNKGGVQEAHQPESKKGTGIESTGSPILYKDALKQTSSHVDESTSSSLDFEETGNELSGSVAASVHGTEDFQADFENVVSTNQKNDEPTRSSESQSNQPVVAKEATETAEAVQAKEPKEHHDWEELQPSTGVGLDDQFMLQEVFPGDSLRGSDEIPESGEIIQHQVRKDQSLVKHGTGSLEDDAFVTVESVTVESYESQPNDVEHKEVVESFMTTDVLQQKDVPQTVSAEGTLSMNNAAPATKHEESAEINDKNFDHLSSLPFSEEKPFFDHGQDQSMEKLKLEMQMMEAALKGAAKQAQTKADEISRLLLENDQLKSTIEDLKRKSSDVELDALREEYQQRLGAAERRVYALTKERDMLRREQNRKSDSSTLLKEKDEIIKQVMAEGEELSKKQAAQEAQMKKLRAQIRELEDEKQRLNSRLQVEEAKVESVRKDKAATEKLLQETVERGQAELATQKEFYLNSLNEAKEALASAEERLDSEAKADLDRRLREAAEREGALVQALEELRQAFSRTEQQAAFREDSLRRDVADLERRCQAAEGRYDELVARVPESTRPLLRQIEAIQESSAMRAEAWTGVERALNSRLQEAEAKAAAAQERERATNERMRQAMSRMAVMEAQVSCLRAEQSQLTRSLEKERQRASESRQEYLAALEMAATQEGRAKQLEEATKELNERHKRELVEEKIHREILEQELEKQKAAIAEGKATTAQIPSQNDYSSSNNLKRLPSVSSSGSLEEGYFLQTSLNLTSERMPGERIRFSELPPSPRVGKGLVGTATLEQLETHLRKKDGELALYAARLASLESTRDSLAEDLVRTTTQCEQLRVEVASLPGLKAELDALRRRHASALELMGERDEEVEELRADLADVKQMYREQIDMLVWQIEKLSSAIMGK